MNIPIASIAVLIIAAVVALLVIVHLVHTLNEARAALEESERSRAFSNAEIQRIQTVQQRKIDRALWMLIQVRTDRAITKAPQLVREPLNVSLSLSADLVDAIERTPTGGENATLRDVVAGHIVRRIAKTATVS
jgi:ABC-type bacteriocin/lantibiotic exporter with double-glycine peptidase domain